MPEQNKAKAAAHQFVAELDVTELTARVAEAAMGLRRPIGMTAAQVSAQAHRMDPETAESFRRIAQAAISYFGECVKKGSRPS